MNYITYSLMSIVLLCSNIAGASAAAETSAPNASNGKMVKLWLARFGQHNHPTKKLILRPTSNTNSLIQFAEVQVPSGTVSLDALKGLAVKEWQLGSKKIGLVRVNDITRHDGTQSYIAAEKEIVLNEGCVTSPSVTLEKDYLKFLIVDEEEQTALQLNKASGAAAAASVSGLGAAAGTKK